ncbi:MAG: phospholipase D-like domain-containing protein [Candidatus Natronoplasma sp.]
MQKLVVLSVLILLTPTFSALGQVEQREESLKLKEVYYNTGPGCEFLTLKNIGATSEFDSVSISDGKNSIELPDFSLNSSEKIVIAEDKRYSEIWDEKPDMMWSSDEVNTDENFELSDESGEVILKNDGVPIDSFYYGDIESETMWEGSSTETLPEGAYARRRDMDKNEKESWTWEREWMVGHSDFEAETISYEGNATAFASPDSSFDSMMYFLDNVNSSLDVAVYQFSSIKIAERIANLSQQGISVKILVEGDPVQGMSQRSRACLSLIADNGGEVRKIASSEYDPYNYYHHKYMIRDNSSVFLTSENFVASSFSREANHGNRGWGMILETEQLASYYGEVFDFDWKFGDYFYTSEEEIDSVDLPKGHYSPFANKTIFQDEFKATPVLAPDTSMSEATIKDMIRSAEESIYVQQYYIRHWESKENPYLEAVKEAAERGIKVKIMLDSTWYHKEDNGNDQIVKELNEFARKEEIELEARSLSRFKDLVKSHNKGMIVDQNTVLVSSINWNANSPLQNREVGVIVENEDIGEYYSNIFLEDWKDHIVPIADAGRDRVVEAGEEITLSGKNSWDDHEIVEYRWDINGDGTYDKKGEQISVKFEEEGTQEITLYVEDLGGNNDTDTFTLEIEAERDFTLLYRVLNWTFLLVPMIVITIFLIKGLVINRS